MMGDLMDNLHVLGRHRKGGNASLLL